MAPSTTKRTRSERVASIQLEPSSLHRWLRQFMTSKNLLQVALASIAAVLIVVILQGWRPSFAYREGQIPQRDIVARVAFDMIDSGQTELLRKQKRREVLCFYENRSQPIAQLISTIKNKFSSLLGDTPYEELTVEQKKTLAEFMPAVAGEADLTEPEALARIRLLLDERTKLEGGKFDQALKSVLDPISETGVLKSIGHDSEQGNQRSIIVFAAGLPEDKVFVDVPKVRHAEIVAELPQKVAERFQQVFNSPDAVIIARMVSKYLVANLPVTLTYQQNLS